MHREWIKSAGKINSFLIIPTGKFRLTIFLDLRENKFHLLFQIIYLVGWCCINLIGIYLFCSYNTHIFYCRYKATCTVVLNDKAYFDMVKVSFSGTVFSCAFIWIISVCSNHVLGYPRQGKPPVETFLHSISLRQRRKVSFHTHAVFDFPKPRCIDLSIGECEFHNIVNPNFDDTNLCIFFLDFELSMEEPCLPTIIFLLLN